MTFVNIPRFVMRISLVVGRRSMHRSNSIVLWCTCNCEIPPSPYTCISAFLFECDPCITIDSCRPAPVTDDTDERIVEVWLLIVFVLEVVLLVKCCSEFDGGCAFACWWCWWCCWFGMNESEMTTDSFDFNTPVCGLASRCLQCVESVYVVETRPWFVSTRVSVFFWPYGMMPKSNSLVFWKVKWHDSPL